MESLESPGGCGSTRASAEEFNPSLFGFTRKGAAAKGIADYLRDNPEPPAYVEWRGCGSAPCFDESHFVIIRVVDKSHQRYSAEKMAAILTKYSGPHLVPVLEAERIRREKDAEKYRAQVQRAAEIAGFETHDARMADIERQRERRVMLWTHKYGKTMNSKELGFAIRMEFPRYSRTPGQLGMPLIDDETFGTQLIQQANEYWKTNSLPN